MTPQHIHSPRIQDQNDDEDRAAVLSSFFGKLKADNTERRAAVTEAVPALTRICEVMQGRTGQAYTLRALLYSLWNGQAVSLLEVVSLDWAIRKDFCAVVLAFGFEDPSKQVPAFFYDAIKAALTAAGQFEWFIEAESEVAA